MLYCLLHRFLRRERRWSATGSLMLQILGNPRRLCHGVSRRDWLQVGALGALGVGLSDVLRQNDLDAAARQHGSSGPRFGQARSCILLLPYGSPPQHETFDPKPDAPANIQGELKAISTNVTGIAVGELLPKISRMVDRLTIVRSMTHPFPVHCTAYVTSGIPDYSPALESRPDDPKLWPYIGSVVDYLDERTGSSRSAVPRNIALPWKMNSRGGPKASAVQAGPYAAFLGPAYNPVLTEFEGEASRTITKIYPANGTKHRVADPYAGIYPEGRFKFADTEHPEGLTLDRLNRRLSLRQQLARVQRRVDASIRTKSFDRFQQMALSLVSSSEAHAALDIQREPMRLRDRYGMTLFGQSCLAARRLVEAGSRFVTVFWDEFAYLNTDWDTHWNHHYRLKDRLLPGFDAAFSTLILDLESRGLLDETLVVWMSEHGRTPKFNGNAGRDHWSRAYSIAMAGGGIGRGQVVGRSDRIAGDVSENPVSPKDVLATMLHLLGIDSHTTIPNRVNQPMLAAGTGVLRRELLSS